MVEGYRISEDLSDMDFAALYQYLSSSYWAEGIPYETLVRALRNSLCFGVFTDAGGQVGFARMITDKATFAYLADVYILEEHRGRGLSKWLMEKIMSHSELQGLRRMALATKDAHGLYEKYGFKALASPNIFMELWNQNVYKNA